MNEKKWPGAWRMPGGNENHTPRYYGQPAWCQLWAVNLVSKFPPRCALATTNPLATIGDVQALAWTELGRIDATEEKDIALSILDDADTCNQCVPRLLRTAKVQQLRHRLRASSR